MKGARCVEVTFPAAMQKNHRPMESSLSERATEWWKREWVCSRKKWGTAWLWRGWGTSCDAISARVAQCTNPRNPDKPSASPPERREVAANKRHTRQGAMSTGQRPAQTAKRSCRNQLELQGPSNCRYHDYFGLSIRPAPEVERDAALSVRQMAAITAYWRAFCPHDFADDR